MSDEPYKLPSSLFSCVQLEHLELHYCSFVPPPRFNGFSKLHSLELYGVTITSEVFSSLISNCPLLKELKLVIPDGSSCLEITAPNLKCLYYNGNFSYIWFKNAPNLARVSIHFPCLMNKVNVSKWVTLFAGLPAIEFLELEYFRLKVMLYMFISTIFIHLINYLFVVEVIMQCFFTYLHVLLLVVSSK